MTENQISETDLSEDPMAAIDKLSELLESQSDEELETLSEEISSKKNFVSTILKDDSELQKPKENIACIGCKSAMWFGSKKYTKCYCCRMFTFTYDSTNMIEDITECDGKEVM